MKKKLFLSLAVVLTIALAMTAFAASRGAMELKAGDEIYACNCGEKCACDTMSRNPGNCTCGKEMVKAKVTKVEEGKAHLQAAGWPKERAFKTSGKYACACPPACKCDTQSQNPGKCTCNVDMAKVKAD